MDAAPRLTLLSFSRKTSPEPAQFAQRLKLYIQEVYREDAESYKNELHQLEGLRATASHPSVDDSGLASLYRYFCQLRALQSRFPMGKGQLVAVQFTWRDVYANINASAADIKFEMASVLYNIGAVHTKLGSNVVRTTSEGLKAACTHYQVAAWAFQQVREQYAQPPGTDLMPEVVRVLQELCFAQAQECILEKSIQDTRKPSVVGAVAMQVVNYYRNSATHLMTQHSSVTAYEIMGSKVGNFLQRYIHFKMAYISCVAYLYQGLNAEEQQKMGERVAYYQLAVDKLAEARKLIKYIEPTEVTQEAVTFTNDVVEGKRKAAKNENEFIYHEEVPAKDLLTELKPVCLVKAIPINFNDPEVSGPDLFARLVPMGAHESSSLYSEEKAKLLRHVISAAEKKDAELAEFMSSLQLHLLEATDSKDSIPQEVVDRCAAMNADSEIIPRLIDSMNTLAEIISDVEHSLAEVKELIQNETEEEKEFQKTMGARPPSIVQTELSREAHKYSEAHNKTSESNQVLHKAMTLHLSNLRLLASPLDHLQQNIPSVNKIEGLDTATMTEMKRIIGKVREMQTQREVLIQQLRDAVNADDITGQLLARSGESPAHIFQEEIEKHKPQVKIIELNLAAQENIINKLTSVYASYGESRRLLTDVVRRRDALINALITSYDTRSELLAKSQKGLEFYRKLYNNVSHLLTRLRSTCQVQREERAQLLAKHSAKSNVATASVKKAETAASIASSAPESAAPKLKDYLPYMKNREAARNAAAVQAEKLSSDAMYQEGMYPTSARPAPLGSEANTDVPQMAYTDGYATTSSQSTVQNMYAPQYNYGEANSYAAQAVPGYQAYANAGQSGAPYDYIQPEKNMPMSQAMENASINYNTYGSNYTPPQYSSQSLNTVPNYYVPYYTGSQDANTNVTNTQNVPQYSTDNVQANTSVAQYTYSAQSYPQQQAYGLPQHPIPAETPPSVPGYADSNASVNSQAELNANFSQMQIAASNASGGVGPTYPEASYSQTYFNVYYPQNSVPNVATYSNAAQPTPTSMSGSQRQVEYNGSSYPYSVADGAAGPSSYQTSAQEATARAASLSYDTSSPASQYSHYGNGVPDGGQQQTPNNMGNSIVSHATASRSSHALSDVGVAAVQSNETIRRMAWGVQAVEPPNQYSLQQMIPSDPSIAERMYDYGQSSPVHMAAGASDYSHTASVGSYAEHPSTSDGVNYMQSYQSHPGYYLNPSSGIYEYNYGYQSTNVDYHQHDQSAGPVHQNQQHVPQNIYTSAGTHETVQSPSTKTEQPTFPASDGDSQSYYNSPYGYQTNASANTNAHVASSSEQANTNYGADTNQPTYMSSGNSRDSTSTYTNQDRPKPTTTPDNTESTPQKSESPKTDKPTEQSTMDLLSELDFSLDQKPLMPEIKVPAVSEHVIRKPTAQPTADQLILKEEKAEDTIERPAKRDLFSDPGLLNKFTQEVKNLQRLVDGLTNKMQSGITVLDNKWKVLHDAQAKENAGRSKSAAMEYSGSNVVSEVVPFDDSRLTLKVNPEVYINASYYKQLAAWCIPLAISNLPEEREHNTFWTAVLENKVGCVVCLLGEMELQGKCYWPTAKGQSLELDNGLRVTLDEATTTVHWTERRFSLARRKTTHTVTHYQINVFPTKVVCGPLVLLVDRVLEATYAGRLSNQLCAAWVHCERGAGRSALVALLTMLVCQVRAGQVNLCDMMDAGCRNLCRGRTNVLEDTKFLADAYRTALFYVQGVLCSGTTSFNGEMVCVAGSAAAQPPPPLSAAPKDKAPKFSKESFEEMKQTAGLKTGDMKDPLSFLDPLWSLKKK